MFFFGTAVRCFYMQALGFHVSGSGGPIHGIAAKFVSLLVSNITINSTFAADY
jgi:hypothetical protein